MNEARAVRQPQKGVAMYRVRLRGVSKFRRAGVEFTNENTPYELARADVEAEAARRGMSVDVILGELLNTPALDVEEVGAARPARDPK